MIIKVPLLGNVFVTLGDIKTLANGDVLIQGTLEDGPKVDLTLSAVEAKTIGAKLTIAAFGG